MIRRALLAALLLLPIAGHAQIMGKPASPVVFNSAAFGANNTPAPDSYYHVDEGSGSTLTNIGKDAGSYNGTITGADWGTESGSTILTCVRANSDSVSFSLPGISGYPFTLAAWVKKTVSGSSDRILGVGFGGATNIEYSSGSSASDRGLIVAQNTSIDSLVATPSTPSNLFDEGVYKLVVVVFRSATDREVYVDDDANNTDTDSVTWSSSVNQMMACRKPNGAVSLDYGDYAIAGLAVWKATGLTDAQVQTDLYNGGSWPPFVTTSTGTAAPQRRRTMQ